MRADMSEPQWPAQRGRERYESLLNIDIAGRLAHGGTWVDVGPGVDALPMRLFLDRADVSLVCVGPHPRNLPSPIDFTLSTIPDDATFLGQWSGKATLVTDVYGSVSYSDDPLLAIACCVLLLAPGGTFAAFTELQRIGGLETWDRAIQWFRRDLQVTLTLQAVSIFEDASQSFATGLRILATRDSATHVDLATTAAQLRTEVGTPVPSATLWEAADRSARICRVDYWKPSPGR
jgi:hypothetical protein